MVIMSLFICLFKLIKLLQSCGRIETLILNNYTFGNIGQINQENTYNMTRRTAYYYEIRKHINGTFIHT
jgi:hypothetical protein